MPVGKRVGWWWAMSSGVILPAVADPGAPTGALAASGRAIAETMSVREIIQMGGWLMYVLGAMSVLGLALILYFLVALRQEQVVPRRTLRQVRAALAGGKPEEARAACQKQRSPMAAIVLAALDYAAGVAQPEAALLKEIIEGEGSRQATRLQNQTQYLLDIGVIAPMIGLLGTVVGMLKAFNAVALDLAKAKPMLLAAGVSQALITTVAGLLVAIPAMIAYAYFRGQTSRLLALLESASAELLSLIVQKRAP